jgi:TPR repeat protein
MGDGVEQDYARALELYRAAADQDDGPAQDMLVERMSGCNFIRDQRRALSSVGCA